jgi:hypothetical protein
MTFVTNATLLNLQIVQPVSAMLLIPARPHLKVNTHFS